jgi:hypothetical protein
MIAIVNVSQEFDPLGVQQYEVRINKEVVTTFEHKRSDGLTVCLRKASEAVEKAKWLKLADEMKQYKIGRESRTK